MSSFQMLKMVANGQNEQNKCLETLKKQWDSMGIEFYTKLKFGFGPLLLSVVAVDSSEQGHLWWAWIKIQDK